MNGIFNNPFKKKERELAAAKEEAAKDKERWREMAMQQAQSVTQSQLASQARVRDLIRQGSSPAAYQSRASPHHSFNTTPQPSFSNTPQQSFNNAQQQSFNNAQQQSFNNTQPPAPRPAAPRVPPGELLPKVQAMLNTLRSMKASDIRAFPVLNEAQRNVQLLQESLNNLSADESAAWRYQILELQQEVKAQTTRILSSVDAPPAQPAPPVAPPVASQQNPTPGTWQSTYASSPPLSTASRPIVRPARAGGARGQGYVAPAQIGPFPPTAPASNQPAMPLAAQATAQATSGIFSPAGLYQNQIQNHNQALAGSSQEHRAVDNSNDDMFSGLSVVAPDPASQSANSTNSGRLVGQQPLPAPSAFSSHHAQQGHYHSSRSTGGVEVGGSNTSASAATQMSSYQQYAADLLSTATANAPSSALGDPSSSSSMNPNQGLSHHSHAVPSIQSGGPPQGSAEGWPQASPDSAHVGPTDTGEEIGLATRRPIKKKTRGLKVGAYNDEGGSAITATPEAYHAQPTQHPSSQAATQGQSAVVAPSSQLEPQMAQTPLNGTIPAPAPRPAFAFGQKQNTPAASALQQATSFQPQPQPQPQAAPSQWHAAAAPAPAASQQPTTQWPPAPAAAASHQAAPHRLPPPAAPLPHQATQPATYPWQQQRNNLTAPSWQAQPQSQWQAGNQPQTATHTQVSGGPPAPSANGSQFLSQASGTLQAPSATANQFHDPQAQRSGSLASASQFHAQPTQGAPQAPSAHRSQFNGQTTGGLQVNGNPFQALSATANQFQAQGAGGFQAPSVAGNQSQAQGSGGFQAPSFAGNPFQAPSVAANQFQAQAPSVAGNQFQAQGSGGFQAPDGGHQFQAPGPGTFNTWQGDQALQQLSQQLPQQASHASPTYPLWQSQAAQPQAASASTSAMHPVLQSGRQATGSNLGAITDLLTFSPQRQLSMQDSGPPATSAPAGQHMAATSAAAPTSLHSLANQMVSEQALQANSAYRHEEPAHTFNANNFTTTMNNSNSNHTNSNHNNSFPSQTPSFPSQTPSFPSQTPFLGSHTIPRSHVAQTVAAFSALPMQMRAAAPVPPPFTAAAAATVTGTTRVRPSSGGLLSAAGVKSPAKLTPHALLARANATAQASNTTGQQAPASEGARAGAPAWMHHPAPALSHQGSASASHSHAAALISKYASKGEHANNTPLQSQPQPQSYPGKGPDSQAPHQQPQKDHAAVERSLKRASEAGFETAVKAEVESVSSVPETEAQKQLQARGAAALLSCQKHATSAASIGQAVDSSPNTHEAVESCSPTSVQQLQAYLSRLSGPVGACQEAASSAVGQLSSHLASQARLAMQKQRELGEQRRSTLAQFSASAEAATVLQQQQGIAAEQEDFESAAAIDAQLQQLSTQSDSLAGSVSQLERFAAQQEQLQLEKLEAQAAAWQLLEQYLSQLRSWQYNRLGTLEAQAEQDMAQAKADYQQAELALQAVAAELDNQSAEIRASKAAMEEQRTAAAANANAERAQLMEKRDNLEREIEDLRQLLAQRERDLLDTKQQLDSSHGQVQQLAASISNQMMLLEQRNEGLGAQRDQFDSQASKLAACRARLDEQSASAARHHAEAVQKLDTLTSASCSCSDKSAAFTKQLHRERENKLKRDELARVDQAAQEKLLGFERYVEELAAGVDDISSKLSQLSAGLAESEARATRALQLLPSMEAAKREAAARKDFQEAARLSAEAKALQVEVDAHGAACQRHAAELEHLPASQSEKEAELASLAPTLSELQLEAAQARFRYLKLLSQQQQLEVQAAVQEQRFEDAQQHEAALGEEAAELEQLEAEWNFSDLPSPGTSVDALGATGSLPWGGEDHHAAVSAEPVASWAADSGGQGGGEILSLEHDGAGGGQDRGGCAADGGEWVGSEPGVDSLWSNNPLAMQEGAGEFNCDDDADRLPQRNDRLGEGEGYAEDSGKASIGVE